MSRTYEETSGLYRQMAQALPDTSVTAKELLGRIADELDKVGLEVDVTPLGLTISMVIGLCDILDERSRP